MSVDSERVAELAAQIDSSLKSLLVHVGQSLRARSRLQSTLRLLQEKAASSTLQSKEELILVQQYQRGRDHSIPGLKALERECIKYDGLVKELAGWISTAKDALEQELVKAKAREETERVDREQKEAKARQEAQEAEAERLEEEKGRADAQPVESKEPEAIVVDDDDDDDEPLASKPTTEQQPPASGAIDLTNDSPTIPPLTSTMTDPASLLASLTGTQGMPTINDNSNSLALDNFDFSQLTGLQQMGPDFNTQATNFPADSSLDFNMDFLDYSNMGGGGEGTDDANNLFGNIDFSALLGGGSSSGTKKE